MSQTIFIPNNTHNERGSLGDIFSFFIWNNQRIKQRKLELQRIFSGVESDVEKEFSFRDKDNL
jgi:hypothetical protein